MGRATEQSSKRPLTVAPYKKKVALLYLEESEGSRHLRLAVSPDGSGFKLDKKKVSLLSGGKPENLSCCENFHLSLIGDGYLLMYERAVGRKKETVTAVGKDLFEFKVVNAPAAPKTPGYLVPEYRFEGNHILYFGTPTVSTAFTKDWKTWRSTRALLLQPRSGFFDREPIRTIAVARVENSIILLYDASGRDEGREFIRVGAAAFSDDNPHKLIWRSETPLFEVPQEKGETWAPLGAVVRNDKILLFFSSADGDLSLVTITNIFKDFKRRRHAAVSLRRFRKNPIIEPDPAHEWESEATFNPAALYIGGKVHLLYRAIGGNGLSVFGYASSKDGYHIDERLPTPAYIPREPFEGVGHRPTSYSTIFASGGGWGGCEDPKLTLLGDRVYLTYVANDGASAPRGAMSSIPVGDFLAHRFDRFDRPRVITPPHKVDKSLCLLPEKFGGKFALFHRIFPDILIDYVDDLELGDETGKWLPGAKRIPTRPSFWDSRKISVGATPIKTRLGWLVIYHGVDDRDPTRYKIGAMVLDPNDLSHVLYRTKTPLLSPEMPYENYWKPGIVYPCGAAVVGDTLFIYYGGGDRVVCVATAKLDVFLGELEKAETARVEYQPAQIIA